MEIYPWQKAKNRESLEIGPNCRGPQTWILAEKGGREWKPKEESFPREREKANKVTKKDRWKAEQSDWIDR